MTNHLYPEWRNANSNRRYPFADDASLVSNTGIALPAALALDARLYNYGTSPRLHLSEIRRTASAIELDLSDDSRRLGTATAAFNSLPATGQVLLHFVSESGRPLGVLLVDSGQLQATVTSEGQALVFSRTTAAFSATVVTPLPRSGLSAIILPSGEALAGAVWLVAGSGVLLGYEEGTVRVDAVGDPYRPRRTCQAEAKVFDEIRCFTTINGVEPDVYGNILITAGSDKQDNVFRIETTADGLLIYAAGVRL